ncbi:MAG: N-acetylmuramic acid 6-phosphate etherase [Clostridia bacterium]|nr:N-acetylmuramic acid 6-phosphate etherase [Clostridia bacterium]MBR4054170.1 N-acetylmuramic acid 6-phosphate etherase [Clostridia bacterium]
MAEFHTLTTEQKNASTSQIDKMSALEIARCINEEDKTVALAVEKCLPEIGRAIDLLAEALKREGRIFYCGAGTSGRLGVVDASEIPPTYGLYGRVIGLMAGGYSAIINPAEDAEDNPNSIADLMREEYGYCEKDILVAISASGSANCVKGALAYARELGTGTICITCNKNSDLIPLCDLAIAAEVGPEVINGSTRMKAGTAQKMILNMLSTGAMVRYGRVRGNYMAYMIPSNRKLVARAIRMICQKTGCTPLRAEEALKKANNVIADAMDAIEAENTLR